MEMLFERSRILFFLQLAWCPDVCANHPIERNYGNSVRFLAKIPNGRPTAASKKNLNVGPAIANRPAFCRQVPLFTRNVPLKTFSRLAGLAFDKASYQNYVKEGLRCVAALK